VLKKPSFLPKIENRFSVDNPKSILDSITKLKNHQELESSLERTPVGMSRKRFEKIKKID
jgi:hypothetical protein